MGLFLDVDGTLLDIAPRPEEVEVTAELLADLAAAERTLSGALALVSGRPIAQLDRLFTPLQIAASGTHGAELRRRPGGAVASLVPGCLGEDAWYAFARLLREFPGSYAENKGVSFAMHYPEGTDADRLCQALTSLAERLANPRRQLRVIAGHAVFEIQLDGFDKGRAIERFMTDRPFRGRQPVFIGDDEIDRAGFDKALALGGFAFSVGIELPGLSGAFSGPDAVRAWLHGLSR
jgi:trehalose 6-phosphate phosphatase